jgi:hypothetical protein
MKPTTASRYPQTTKGAQFEIVVDDKPRSYRDIKETAIEAAEYLKRQRPNSKILVRDVHDNVITPIDFKPEPFASVIQRRRR